MRIVSKEENLLQNARLVRQILHISSDIMCSPLTSSPNSNQVVPVTLPDEFRNRPVQTKLEFDIPFPNMVIFLPGSEDKSQHVRTLRTELAVNAWSE